MLCHKVAHMQLTSKQVDEFKTHGLLKLTNCVEPKVASRITNSLWNFLENEQGISKNDPNTWPPGYRPTGFQELTRTGTFRRMASPLLCDAVDELLGHGASCKVKNWGIPLMLFPDSNDGQRTIPFGSDTWHIDAPARTSSCYAIRAFLLLQDVPKHQGPTMAVAGSSNLLRQLAAQKITKSQSSKTVLKQLIRSEPWINRLLSEPDSAVRERLYCWGKSNSGLPLKVTEFTGDSGDVFLMDISTIHSKSRNTAKLPRMVLSQTFFG
ncbi:MAG: hypothetical protein F4X44_12355 [Gammaproteobacteria bacterium]|nr:hypothetical protein [Gammaproteobacteria bacterium]